MAALLVLSATSSVWATDVPISDEARQHFRRGVGLLRASGGPQYQEAYVAFKAAHAASPSPKILGNIGLCAMKLERDGEAIEAYERYLSESAAVSKKEAAQIISDLVKLKGRVARLRLTFDPPDVTVVDERQRDDGPPIVNEYEVKYGRLALGVRMGRHRITVQRAGYEPESWELETSKGLVWQRAVTLKPQADGSAEPPDGSDQTAGTPDEPAADETDGAAISTGVWIGIGVTGALAVATAVVGGVALANKSSFDEKLEAGDTDAAVELRDTGQVLNVTTDILLGTTVAAAAATVIVYFAGSGSQDETAWSLGPSVAPGWAGLTLQGVY